MPHQAHSHSSSLSLSFLQVPPTVNPVLLISSYHNYVLLSIRARNLIAQYGMITIRHQQPKSPRSLHSHPRTIPWQPCLESLNRPNRNPHQWGSRSQPLSLFRLEGKNSLNLVPRLPRSLPSCHRQDANTTGLVPNDYDAQFRYLRNHVETLHSGQLIDAVRYVLSQRFLAEHSAVGWLWGDCYLVRIEDDVSIEVDVIFVGLENVER